MQYGRPLRDSFTQDWAKYALFQLPTPTWNLGVPKSRSSAAKLGLWSSSHTTYRIYARHPNLEKALLHVDLLQLKQSRRPERVRRMEKYYCQSCQCITVASRLMFYLFWENQLFLYFWCARFVPSCCLYSNSFVSVHLYAPTASMKSAS